MFLLFFSGLLSTHSGNWFHSGLCFPLSLALMLKLHTHPIMSQILLWKKAIWIWRKEFCDSSAEQRNSPAILLPPPSPPPPHPTHAYPQSVWWKRVWVTLWSMMFLQWFRDLPHLSFSTIWIFMLYSAFMLSAKSSAQNWGGLKSSLLNSPVAQIIPVMDMIWQISPIICSEEGTGGTLWEVEGGRMQFMWGKVIQPRQTDHEKKSLQNTSP